LPWAGVLFCGMHRPGNYWIYSGKFWWVFLTRFKLVCMELSPCAGDTVSRMFFSVVSWIFFRHFLQVAVHWGWPAIFAQPLFHAMHCALSGANPLIGCVPDPSRCRHTANTLFWTQFLEKWTAGVYVCRSSCLIRWMPLEILVLTVKTQKVEHVHHRTYCKCFQPVSGRR